MEAIIQMEKVGLAFRKGTPVLADFNLQVPTGSIYGFLGPNGAGKTTTLRILLGLLNHQSGAVRVFNQDITTHRAHILSRTGSLIESPSIYGHLSAMENLHVWRVLYNVPRERLLEVLTLVGLKNTGNKAARHFSLGMKQRLAIAVALLHRPTLLVLDEPTNGLDPEGILEMRDLLRHLNREQGMSIIVSSHLLSEVERVASHIGIIHQGTMKFEGSLEELKKLSASTGRLHIITSDMERAGRVLDDHRITFYFGDGRMVLPTMEPDEVARINKLLVMAECEVHHVAMEKNDLESIFIHLIQYEK